MRAATPARCRTAAASAACILGVCLAGLFLPMPASAEEPVNFITRRGDQLMDGDRVFRFVSFNVPNLMVIEDAYDFTRPHPWRWPNEFEIEDTLESIRQMGGQVVRTYVISVYREGSDMGEYVHVRRPGEFNEEGLRALDKVIEIARRKGIRVIIPLVDQHKWWGGIGEYAAFRKKPAEEFWSDRQIIDDFKATVRHLLTRDSVYTGVAYRDEPAILGWETGNELDSTPEWTREIAAYLKELDPNHLVIDGRSLHGVPLTSLEDPSVDVITTHHYPWGDDHDFTRPIRAAHDQTKGKKPYFVGEFGFVETPHLAAAIQTVIDDGISGALLWSLRMHRREGGFYWHMEVGTGRNIYKAFHWPGFGSGDRYDERAVMQMMRRQAYEIRGMEPPPVEPPAAPRLLPIEQVSAISWQGSAGASSYDIWRTDVGDEDWKRIAENVSDADVQYRPLFNDDNAVPGMSYRYAVTARNAAGASQRSNVVGPVKVRCRTLVDECRDLAYLDSVEGDVSLATENARTVQEDCHRFAMQPGSAVVYRVRGPIGRVRIFSFVRNDGADLDVSISADGRDFKPLEVRPQAFESAQSVYGYLTPVLVESALDQQPGSTYLRLALSGPKDGVSERSEKNEGASPPLEVSRVEIEYDRVDSSANEEPRQTSSGPPTPAQGTVFVDSWHPIETTLATIDMVAARGDRRLNVCVTVLVDLTDDLTIKTYGSNRRPAQHYRPFDDTAVRQLQNDLCRVFARMREHEMDICILPHIDAGGEIHTWRNWVDFDPLAAHGGYSYASLMIDSIADALAATIDEDTKVEMALSGEMGTSLFRYPASYRAMIRRLRARPDLKQLKIGISLNHSGISGQNNPTGADDIELDGEQRAELQALIDECDFVGMSFYRPVGVRPTTADFVRGIEHFMGEFQAHGLEVPLSKPMHFSEVGIGGGHDDDDRGYDPTEAVKSPWEGSGDPRTNPWLDPAMQRLRRRYHEALLAFLDQQASRWHVSAAFFWSTGSWDPQGLQHPVFADSEIAAAIERHNRAAAAK